MNKELVNEINTSNKNAKSIKVSSTTHVQINLLKMFIGDDKSDIIIKKLIDSYVTHELTNRQQQQFNSIKEIIIENK